MPSDQSADDREWCDECGHEVGVGSRLSYEVDGRLLCGRCVDAGVDQEDATDAE